MAEFNDDEDDYVEVTDDVFLLDIADRLFNLAPSVTGMDQYYSDRLSGIAQAMRTAVPVGEDVALEASPAPQIIPDMLLNHWDRLSGAINRVVTSQPAMLSESVNKMQAAQGLFERLLFKIAMNRPD
jgi:hypothetical protein